jgi:MFS family permease
MNLKRILTLILLFIFAEILCENFIVIIYNEQSHIQAFYLLLIYMLLQIFFAPIQSGVSDFIGRKKSLIFSLSFSFFSLFIIFLYIKKIVFWFPMLIFATLIKGIFGNTLPLSLAAIADTQSKNYRFSFALSSGTYAVAYLILIFSSNTLNVFYVNYILSLLIIFLIGTCITFFKDIKDKNFTPLNSMRTTNFISKKNYSIINVVKNEITLIIKELKQKATRNALTAFFLWEVSMYSILVAQVDFRIYKSFNFAAIMMVGYIVGILFLRFCYKIKDSKIIEVGYYVSTISLIPYFIFFYFIDNMNILLQVCYFFHALGNAFLSPAFMSILAKEKPPHEQGKRYGLIESFDTIGFLVSVFVVFLFVFLKLHLFYLVSFSFCSFMVSWVFYGRFKNVEQ